MNDFLIIGGGIAGISVAARLSAFAQVTVLEAESALGYHASGRSAAMFEENYGSPSTVALNRASKAYHDTAQVLNPRGLLMVGSDTNTEVFEADFPALGMSEIPVSDAFDRVPILNRQIVKRAAHHADAMDIDTDLLLQSFAREARRNGAEIVTDAPAKAISRSATGWIVQTTAATYEGGILINAAGGLGGSHRSDGRHCAAGLYALPALNGPYPRSG